MWAVILSSCLSDSLSVCVCLSVWESTLEIYTHGTEKEQKLLLFYSLEIASYFSESIVVLCWPYLALLDTDYTTKWRHVVEYTWLDFENNSLTPVCTSAVRGMNAPCFERIWVATSNYYIYMPKILLLSALRIYVII